jgi:hypothetical protein
MHNDEKLIKAITGILGQSNDPAVFYRLVVGLNVKSISDGFSEDTVKEIIDLINSNDGLAKPIKSELNRDLASHLRMLNGQEYF